MAAGGGTEEDTGVYNPQTVETIAGEVVTVDRFTPAKGMSHGVHLTVRTDKETISVHLGPSWYIENQDVKILPKDKIEVKGSRVTYEGKPAIVAATLTKGNEQLVLRDAAGSQYGAAGGTGRRPTRPMACGSKPLTPQSLNGSRSRPVRRDR